LGGAKNFLAPVRLDVRTGHFPEIPMAKQSGTERYAGFSAAGAGEVKPKFGRAQAAYDEKMLIR
jgi:hypothetical protein